MSQAMGIPAVAILSWFGWNYGLAFGSGNMLIGNLAKAGLAGLDVHRGRSGATARRSPSSSSRPSR